MIILGVNKYVYDNCNRMALLEYVLTTGNFIGPISMPLIEDMLDSLSEAEFLYQSLI